MKYVVEPSINEFLKSDDRAHCRGGCPNNKYHPCNRYGCDVYAVGKYSRLRFIN